MDAVPDLGILLKKPLFEAPANAPEAEPLLDDEEELTPIENNEEPSSGARLDEFPMDLGAITEEDWIDPPQ
jgi:hypothetical protein